MKKNKEVITRVSEIYKWIEAQQLAHKEIAGRCEVCGKCCDFEAYGHRLYVTTPEMIYFVEKIGKANVKQMTTGRCCYQVDGPGMVSLSNRKCGVHAYRFLGCRIFCCRGEREFQSELMESAIKKFKALCDELQIPYRYVELPAALKSAVTVEKAE
jgi:Fe-S-cluster containining protein